MPTNGLVMYKKNQGIGKFSADAVFSGYSMTGLGRIDDWIYEWFTTTVHQTISEFLKKMFDLHCSIFVQFRDFSFSFMLTESPAMSRRKGRKRKAENLDSYRIADYFDKAVCSCIIVMMPTVSFTH